MELELEYESDQFEILTFLIEDEPFCLNAHEIQEVVDLPHISYIPGMPEYFEGMFNLRGDILKLINFRAFIQHYDTETYPTCKVIIININVDGVSSQFGLIVDSILDFQSVTSDNCFQIPPILSNYSDLNYIHQLIYLENYFFPQINPMVFLTES